MSSRMPRKDSAEALAHPDIVALVSLGKAVGEVSAEAVRQTSESAGLQPHDLRALLTLLSAEGISVSVGATDTAPRKRVAAATSTARKVTASTTKKAPAKKAPAAKAAPEGVDGESLDRVRAFKKEMKSQAKAARAQP